MSAAAAPSGLAASTERVIGAWYDHPRPPRFLLVLSVIGCPASHAPASGPTAPPPEGAELSAGGRPPPAAYYKPPPLGALMTAGWFAVFPTADWAFHLLAMVNAAIGLA